MRGMNRQLDPGAIPPNQFYHLQNARLLEGEVVSRGGSSKVNTNAETGCITGLFDNLEPSATGEMLLGIQANPGAPFMANLVLTDIQGTSLSSLSQAGVNGVYTIAIDDTSTYIYFSRSATGGNDLNVYRIAVAGITGNTASIYFSSTSSANSRRAGSIIDFGSKIWLGQGEDAANGLTKVFSYDGVSLVAEDSIAANTGGSASAILGESHNNQLMYGFRWVDRNSSGSGVVIPAMRIRDSGGSWSSVALPAVWASGRKQFYTSDIAVYGSKTWLAGWTQGDGTYTTGNIASWSTAATEVVDERLIGTSLSGGTDRDYVTSLAVLGGYLYYCWVAATGASRLLAAYIGRYDGATWNNTYVDLLAQFPELATATTGSAFGLRVFNGKLSIMLKLDDSDGSGYFATANDEDPSTFTVQATLVTMQSQSSIDERYSPTYAGPFQIA